MFGVQTGKLLGYMVIERGIEVNPAKVKAIIELAPPKNLKEAQVLAGNVMALSRFIWRLAAMSLPFFSVLRKGDKIEWTESCQNAFEQLKEFLLTLPMLKQPEENQPLVVYLAVRVESVSAVLIREEKDKQFPVYFISRVLQGVKKRCSGVEENALALVTTARRLRPYFLSHPIVVRTNHPLTAPIGSS